MMLSNMHTHSEYCDGKGPIREYIEKAIEKGFRSIGFSGHAPLPFGNDWTMTREGVLRYGAELKRLKKEYEGKIEVLIGLEVDFLEDESHYPYWADISGMPLDYRIGSVHMVHHAPSDLYYAVDGDVEHLKEAFKAFGSVQNVAEAYYKNITRMLKRHIPDIIGHFDLIKKRNKNEQFFSEQEPWYMDAAFKALNTVAESGALMEINTGGIARGATTEVYPSEWILKEALRRGIPVCINADAHDPAHVDYYFPETIKKLKKIGYSRIHYFYGGAWHAESIK